MIYKGGEEKMRDVKKFEKDCNDFLEELDETKKELLEKYELEIRECEEKITLRDKETRKKRFCRKSDYVG